MYKVIKLNTSHRHTHLFPAVVGEQPLVLVPRLLLQGQPAGKVTVNALEVTSVWQTSFATTTTQTQNGIPSMMRTSTAMKIRTSVMMMIKKKNNDNKSSNKNNKKIMMIIGIIKETILLLLIL